MSYKDSLWTTDHLGSIGTISFDVALEMGQYCDILGACSNSEGHYPENVGWLAIERTSGNLSDIKFDSGVTATNIQGRDDSPGCFFNSYSTTFSSVPVVFADLNVRNGADGGWSGGCSLDTANIGLHVNEEDESDGESSHTTESAAYVSFENEGQINLIKEITSPTISFGSENIGPSVSNGSGNFSYVFQSPSADGIYDVMVEVNYSDVVTGKANINLIVDSSAPVISLLSPSNNSFINNNTPILTYEVNDLSPLINCSLYINDSYNKTDTNVNSGNNTFFMDPVADGYYSWKIECYDYLTNSNFSEENILIVDTNPPIINLNSPVEQFNTSNQSITFNYSYSDSYSGNASCNLLVDDGSFSNDTLIKNINYDKTLDVSVGFRTWNVSCTDLAGNTGYSSNRNFTVLGSPQNLRVIVAGNDINLSWDVVEGAITYEVYSTDNYSLGFGAVPNFTTSNTSIIDLSPPDQRFYYVKAIRGSVNKNSSRKAGYFKDILYSDYNLVSNPFEYYPVVWKNSTNDGFEFFDDGCLESVWKYTPSGFLRTDWNGNYFTPAIGSESFTVAETNSSYWIYANNTCNMTFTGYVRENNLTSSLSKNLNTPSYNRIINTTLPTNYGSPVIITAPSNIVQAIDRFNPLTQEFEVTIHYLVGGNPWGWYPSANNPSFDSLEEGRGYYFDAMQNGTLTQVGE